MTTTLRLAALAPFALLTALGCSPAAPDEPASAVVVHVEGTAEVVREGARKPLAARDELAANDLIETGKASFILLHLNNGHLVKLDGELSVRLANIAEVKEARTELALAEQMGFLTSEERARLPSGEVLAERVAGFQHRRRAGRTMGAQDEDGAEEPPQAEAEADKRVVKAEKSDPKPEPLGRLEGGAIGDAPGLGGLGLSGTGSGGGGLGDGVIGLGNVGQLGAGAGGLGAKATRSVGVKTAKLQVSGGLPVEVIRRVVRQHQAEVRFCYNRLKKPEVKGRLSVNFAIDAKGSVVEAALKSNETKNDELGKCVVARVKRWRFPMPEKGQIVKVTLPFVFTPAE